MSQPTLFPLELTQPPQRPFAVPPADQEFVPLDPACVPTLSLYQPWASLVDWGVKQIETRGYPTSYRGWMAIAATIPNDKALQASLTDPQIRKAISDHGASIISLPHAAVLCMVRVIACRRTEDMEHPGFPEFYFGNYAPRRYAWFFDRCISLPHPIPVKGKQRIWKWTPADDVRIWIAGVCK